LKSRRSALDVGLVVDRLWVVVDADDVDHDGTDIAAACAVVDDVREPVGAAEVGRGFVTHQRPVGGREAVLGLRHARDEQWVAVRVEISVQHVDEHGRVLFGRGRVVGGNRRLVGDGWRTSESDVSDLLVGVAAFAVAKLILVDTDHRAERNERRQSGTRLGRDPRRTSELLRPLTPQTHELPAPAKKHRRPPPLRRRTACALTGNSTKARAGPLPMPVAMARRPR
jgi:hypothetical protein